MQFKYISALVLSLVILFFLIEDVACAKSITTNPRLNRRKLAKRQGYYYPASNTPGYQVYPEAAAYPGSYAYPQVMQPAPAPAPAPAAAQPENPLGGLLSNLKLPALPSFAPAATSGNNPYAGFPFYAGAPKKDDDEDEEEDDDDKNNEDSDDEE